MNGELLLDHNKPTLKTCCTMTTVTSDVPQVLCETLSESSAEGPDLAKVIEDRRIRKESEKYSSGESADSWGSASRKASQRVAKSDSEMIHRSESYFALLLQISKLEAEKGDLQMQMEFDAMAYREVYKVAQELEENLTAANAEIEDNLVEIAALRIKCYQPVNAQSYPAINSSLISSSSLDAASDSDCKPGRDFLVGRAIAWALERLTSKVHLLLYRPADAQHTKLDSDAMLLQESRSPSPTSPAINLGRNKGEGEYLESIEEENSYSMLVAEFHVRDVYAGETLPERMKRKFHLLHLKQARAQLHTEIPQPHEKRTKLIAKLTANKLAVGWGWTHPTHYYSL